MVIGGAKHKDKTQQQQKKHDGENISTCKAAGSRQKQVQNKRKEGIIKIAESIRDSEEGTEATGASGPQHLLDKVAGD